MKKMILSILMLFSSLFAKNAHFLSVQVGYLSEQDKVILNETNDKDELIYLYISLLDKDGNFAKKSVDGLDLREINASNVESLVEATIIEAQDVDEQEATKENLARFMLDYSSVSTSEREDIVTVAIGGLEKKITVNFGYVSAKGLVVRVATKTVIPDKLQGYYFTDIVPDSDNNLSIQSKTYLGGVAGSVVPIKIYASSEMQDDSASDGALVNGRFTISDELNNEIVIVKVLGDYDADGNASVLIGQAEGRLQNGIAELKVPISHGLPADRDNVHSLFNKKKAEGLGIAFVAYLKNDLTVSNKGSNLQQSIMDDPSQFYIRGDHNATDTVVISSDDALNMKIGIFDKTAQTLSQQWSKPYVNYYVLDDNQSSTEQNISLTMIDGFGNPSEETSASLTTCIHSKQDYFDIDCRDGFREDDFSIASKVITIKPNDSAKLEPDDSDYYGQINPFVQESKNVSLDMKIIGSAGLTSAATLDVTLYMGRVTTNYITTKGRSDTFGDANITLENNDTKRDYKVILTQKETNTSLFNVEIYDRHIEGDYDDDNLYADRVKTIDGVTLSSLDVNSTLSLQGAWLRIEGVGNVQFPSSFAYSQTFPLDGFTAYFFAVQDGLDNHVVILADDDLVDSSGTRTRVDLGTDLNFRIYGLASKDNDYVQVRYGDIGQRTQIGLLKDQAISSQPNIFTNEVGDFVSKANGLTVRGYSISSVSPLYITINGHDINTTADTTGKGKVVSLDSDFIIDESERDGLWPNIQFDYKNANDDQNTKQVNIVQFGIRNIAIGKGTSETDLLTLADIDGDKVNDNINYFKPSINQIVYKGEVYANRYYLLFDERTDLEERDAFGNVLFTNEDNSRDLKKYKYDISGDGTIDDNSLGDIFIKFDYGDVGRPREASIRADEGENTILFTNIVGSSYENSIYDIALYEAKSNTALVNTEVLISVKGDNQVTNSDFTLTFTHSDKEANTYIRMTGFDIDFDGDDVNTVHEALQEDGNYYLFRTDKAGTITIKAHGIETDEDGEEVIVTSTLTLYIVDQDDDVPVVDISQDKNKITVTITDKSLDYEKTVVDIRSSEGIAIKESVRQGDTYTISELPAGIYQLHIYAVDLFGNEYSQTFLRTITETIFANEEDYSLDDKLLAQALIAHKGYPIYGKFSLYDFGVVDYYNWIFQDETSSKTYKIFATSSDANPFGFKEFTPDFTKIDKKSWYLAQLTGEPAQIDEKGKLGWVLVSDDLQMIKKIVSINQNGSLKYSPLPIKARIENRQISFYEN